ncbi:uncharacterized protein LOC126317105 [Schistocerca gregaria]|uniref:uncharacterized protein LOC126317105 n=1 Tax=Schistocerca gregaria TaxID=7010 RepID=UPI00211E46F5|nr:uncharacterized protein LOC126317105 [Schistocerca gregaria]XP_049849038.1 uncharacterized protein LOC126317105 [Schistocerca gregaria]
MSIHPGPDKNLDVREQKDGDKSGNSDEQMQADRRRFSLLRMRAALEKLEETLQPDRVSEVSSEQVKFKESTRSPDTRFGVETPPSTAREPSRGNQTKPANEAPKSFAQYQSNQPLKRGAVDTEEKKSSSGQRKEGRGLMSSPNANAQTCLKADLSGKRPLFNSSSNRMSLLLDKGRSRQNTLAQGRHAVNVDSSGSATSQRLPPPPVPVKPQNSALGNISRYSLVDSGSLRPLTQSYNATHMLGAQHRAGGADIGARPGADLPSAVPSTISRVSSSQVILRSSPRESPVSPVQERRGHAEAVSNASQTEAGTIRIDEKGRQFTVGKPRDSSYYMLNIEEPTNNNYWSILSKNKSIAAVGNFAKGIAKNLSKNRASLELGEGDAYHGQGDDWDMPRRAESHWQMPCLDRTSKEVQSLVDMSVLDEGYHIELGVPGTSFPETLSLDYESEYTPYYGKYIYNVNHVNYIGHDEENDTYWVVSIESLNRNRRQEFIKALVRGTDGYYRLKIETSLLQAGGIGTLADKAKGSGLRKLQSAYKDIPELERVKFVRVRDPGLKEELLSMEEKEVALGAKYKFGVLYVKPDQTENEIFANCDPSPAFYEFLEFLGEKIELRGWSKFRGGLDVKTGNTGEHSIYHEINGIEIMFHVCVMLPSQPNDLQRVERKRHIGNDVVVFVFLEEGCEPYLVTKLTSKFVQVQYIVKVCPGTGTGPSNPTKYMLAVVTKAGIEPHMPQLLFPSIYERTPEFRNFLLTKAINSERASLMSAEFHMKARHTRKFFMKDLYERYS